MKVWAKQKGFTIVELLIVIVVIGILAAITIVAYSGVQSRAYDNRRSSDVASIKKALEMYKADKGYYPAVCPADNQGCNVQDLTAQLVPVYISSVPQDPKQPTKIYYYVRGTETANSYAVRVDYDKGACKTGVNVNSGWWNSTDFPIC